MLHDHPSLDGPIQLSQRRATLRSTVPFDDSEHCILAQSKPVADFPIRLAFADQLEHLRCKSIRFDTLARPAAKHDAALLRGGDAGSDPLAQQIPFEFRQRRHQRGDELALRAGQIELKTGLSDQ